MLNAEEIIARLKCHRGNERLFGRDVYHSAHGVPRRLGHHAWPPRPYLSDGETRFHSVQNGLRMLQGDGIVFVHDAVRCLVTTQLIHRCYEHALQMGSAVPVVRAKDSVRMLNEELNDNEVLDRTKVVLVQTPQTFHSRILRPAFEIDYKERFTDEATVVEAFGLKISLVEGEEHNLKITRPVDLLIAEKILDAQQGEKIGLLNN